MNRSRLPKSEHFVSNLLLLAFCLVCLPLFHVEATKIYVLPEGSTSTGPSFTCPAGLVAPSTLCVNTIQKGVQIAASGDLVEVLGSLYHMLDSESYWANDFIRITTAISLFTNITSGTIVHLFQPVANLGYGVTINSDNVYISGIQFTTDASPGILAVLQITISSNNTKRWTGDVQYISSQEDFNQLFQPREPWEYRESTKITSWAQQFSQRKRSSPPGQTSSFCIDCFCGCGSILPPGSTRNNITIVNSGFNGTASLAVIFSTGTFGFTNISITLSTVFQQTLGGLNVWFNLSYVATSDFTKNFYGTCVYPNNRIDSCSVQDFLPYYIDPNFQFLGPIVNGNGTAYPTIDAALGDSVIDIQIRGQVYVTDTVLVNRGVTTIRPADQYSCCASINVADNVNPAFLVAYQCLTLRDLTLNMGANSGGVVVRDANPISVSIFSVITYFLPVNISIQIQNLVPASFLDMLNQTFSPAFIPAPGTYRTNVLEGVYMTNSTPTPYSYGVMYFPLNVGLFQKHGVINSAIEGCNVGMVDTFFGLQFDNNYIDANVVGLALNASGAFTQSNKVILRYQNTVGFAFNASSSAMVIDNVFYLLDGTAVATLPNIFIGVANNLQYNPDAYPTYVLLRAVNSCGVNWTLGLIFFV